MTMIYNNPAGGSQSTIGNQIRTDYYDKKSLIEVTKEQYFQPLASTVNQPKHMGKTIKKYLYLPLLDDRNINDQGIDADGQVLTPGEYSAVDANGQIISSGHADEATALAVPGAVTAVGDGGNLYGSSKDIGAISGKLPVLGEEGGRVNRVGFSREILTGTIAKYGFFWEITQDAMDFDSDEMLYEHCSRENVRGANEITEALLQKDLINNAGVSMFAGDATNFSEVDSTDVVTYKMLLKLAITLDNNRCPKHTKVVKGSRMIDTRTIPSARVMYVGSELQPLLEGMKDLHEAPAFTPAHKYASAADLLEGEIGSIGYFRIVVVPEMQKWTGRGAAVAGVDTHYETNGKFDVFPMLVVGSESFSAITFKTDGKGVKFKIIVKKPGEEVADANDPYGEKGFSSIKWWYGFLPERTERLALIKTAAPK